MNRMLVTLAALGLLIVATGAARKPEGDAGQSGEASRFSGVALYRTYCASCHGENARGNGAVAMFLRRQPADLTQIAKHNKGKFPAERVFQMIDGRQAVKAHGESQMPVWGDAFAKTATDSDAASVKARISALVDYLASIQERQGP